MKTVVIGGSGLVSSQVVSRLREHGHEAMPASPDTVTGAGPAEALRDAAVVIDVSNSPSFDNLLAAEARAGVAHHVAVSIVGATQFFEFAGRFADGATVEIAGPEQFRMNWSTTRAGTP